VFYIVASFTQQKHWLLTKTEAIELGKASWDLIKSGPEKKSKRLEKFLKDHAPWIKFAMVFGSITIIRVSQSAELATLKKENERLRTSSGGPDSGPTVNAAGAADFVQ
jgi:hypothetical protein